MKLSQLKTEDAASVLCEVSVNVINIIKDKGLMDTLRSKIDGEDLSKAEMWAIAVEKMGTLIPILLRDHRDDVFSIVAAVNGKTLDDVKNQSIISTMMDIRDIIKDKDMVAFFKSCAPGVKE